MESDHYLAASDDYIENKFGFYNVLCANISNLSK